MKSEHINIKLNQMYMRKIKKIAAELGIKDLSSVRGSIPTVIKFSITLAEKTLNDIAKVIPTLHPSDLHILLTSIKNKKTLEYHKEMQDMKAKQLKK